QLNDLAQPVGHELRELGQIGGNRAALSFGTKFEPRGLGSFVSSALMYLRRRIPSGPVTRHSLASRPGRGKANPPRLPPPPTLLTRPHVRRYGGCGHQPIQGESSACHPP